MLCKDFYCQKVSLISIQHLFDSMAPKVIVLPVLSYKAISLLVGHIYSTDYLEIQQLHHPFLIFKQAISMFYSSSHLTRSTGPSDALQPTVLMSISSENKIYSKKPLLLTSVYISTDIPQIHLRYKRKEVRFHTSCSLVLLDQDIFTVTCLTSRAFKNIHLQHICNST